MPNYKLTQFTRHVPNLSYITRKPPAYLLVMGLIRAMRIKMPRQASLTTKMSIKVGSKSPYFELDTLMTLEYDDSPRFVRLD